MRQRAAFAPPSSDPPPGRTSLLAQLAKQESNPTSCRSLRDTLLSYNRYKRMMKEYDATSSYRLLRADGAKTVCVERTSLPTQLAGRKVKLCPSGESPCGEFPAPPLNPKPKAQPMNTLGRTRLQSLCSQ